MQEHRGRYSSMLSGDESGPNAADTHGRLGYDSAQENGAAVDVENTHRRMASSDDEDNSTSNFYDNSEYTKLRLLPCMLVVLPTKHEFLCILYALLWFFIGGTLCSMSISYVHHNMSPLAREWPLNDTILDNFPKLAWGFQAADIYIKFTSFLFFTMLFFHKERYAIARRFFFIMGTLFLYRALLMAMTFLPKPDVTKVCDPQGNTTDWKTVVKSGWTIMKTLGMNIPFCGDYMYSGHTLSIMSGTLFLQAYLPDNIKNFKRITNIILFVAAHVSLCFIVLSREHYTIDVLIGYFYTVSMVNAYHTMRRTQYYPITYWWHFIWCWMENDKPDGSVQENMYWDRANWENRRKYLGGTSSSENASMLPNRFADRHHDRAKHNSGCSRHSSTAYLAGSPSCCQISVIQPMIRCTFLCKNSGLIAGPSRQQRNDEGPLPSAGGDAAT